MRILRRFLEDQGGATAIEYGLIITLMGIVIVTAASNLGNVLYNRVSTVATTLAH